uniref:Uncharacterized protein n=1 Tax=Rhizophora mucronata TaxID=61149 RepID=A0A2P2M2Q4_RHIMU
MVIVYCLLFARNGFFPFGCQFSEELSVCLIRHT